MASCFILSFELSFGYSFFFLMAEAGKHNWCFLATRLKSEIKKKDQVKEGKIPSKPKKD